MALDPYSPCPCGSGKKAKFCCLDIAAEMEKVGRQKSNGQIGQAMTALERLQAKHPSRPWVVTTLAALLNDEGRFEEARDALKGVLKVDKSHPLANALYAMTSFNLDGWPAAKKIVHRAFKACLKDRPDAVHSLANAVADELYDQGHLMGARQHYVLAMKFAPPDVRKESFMTLMELDGDTQHFYPLRGPHVMTAVDVSEAQRPTYETALKQAAIGLFAEAADSLEETIALGDAPADMSAELGLLCAWDGDPERAAEAFFAAADATDNDEDAVHWLTLGGLLQMEAAADSAPLVGNMYRTESVAKTLGRLDEHPRLVRSAEPTEQEIDAVAMYVVLDRDAPEAYDDDVSLDDLAHIIGRVVVYDSTDRPQITLFAVENEEMESATAVLTEADDSLQKDNAVPEAERTLGRVSAEVEAIRWEPFFPPKTPGAIRRRLSCEWWGLIVDERWPETPSRVLGGKTPKEMDVGDPAGRRRLMAAVGVLDALCDTRRVRVPVARLAEQHNLPAPAPLPVTDDLAVNTLTVSELMRIDRSQLSEEQFRLVLQRVLLIAHSRFTSEVLAEAIDRDITLDGVVDREKALFMLADSAHQAMDLDEALRWVERGLADLGDGPQAFEQRIRWKMTELGYRLESPTAPETTALLQELWDEYGAKVPELRESLLNLVADFDITPPWGQVEAVGSTSAGGIWTPESDAPSGGGKLVLP